MPLTMKEWVQNELYIELIQMPLWTQAAFGSLKEGDVLAPDDTRYILLVYLCKNHFSKVPDDLYDVDYYHSWSVKDFIPVVKAAVKQSPKVSFSNAWS